MKDFLKVLVFGGLFAIPFLTLYVENDYFFPFITGKNFAFRIIVEVMFASWAILALADRDYRPKFSWMLTAFSALIVIMFFANLFGQYPLKSFWSNFERMEGYVTLVHLFMYFVVAGSVMATQKLWTYLLHTSLAVAFFVSLYGLAQYSGAIEGRNRIDSRLGNAAYLAIYMLFHIFFIFWLFVKSQVTWARILYAALSLMFIFTLLQTGTRGTTIALAVGITVMAFYIGLFGGRYKEFRNFAIGSFILLIIMGSTFFALRDSQMVQDSITLRRIANISVDDLWVRFTIWGMAWEGVQERPLLGWGQGNFNYVFNTHYEPTLYAQEQWFDRVHNIFFDWLIAGGVLGFVAYFSILGSALYYLGVRPLLQNDDSFDVLERGVLIGLLAGYFTHNLVVFDNIISYIFLITILALIHSRVATRIPSVDRLRFDDRIVYQFAAPLIILVVGAAGYFANAPGMTASAKIIDAFQARTLEERQAAFEAAYAADSFADQEITEQLVQQTMRLISRNEVTPQQRDELVAFAEEKLLDLIAQKPGDARIHVFLAGLYRSSGQLEKAYEQATIAHELSPAKQSIAIERGVIAYQLNLRDEAETIFEQAFRNDESFVDARFFYASMLFYNGKPEEAKALIGDEYFDRFALNNFGLSGVQQSGDREYLKELFRSRVEQRPDNQQHRASLAYLYYEDGELDEAIAVLEAAAEEIPTFSAQAQCFIANLEAGNRPDEGCSQ